MSSGLEKTVKIVDPKGRVLAELQKIVKDVTVEEFKKMLVSFKPFRKITNHQLLAYLGLGLCNKLNINMNSHRIF